MDFLYFPSAMNVIMPTAMKTMHQDAELQQQSAITATRGVRLLKYLRTLNGEVEPNCRAILNVATDADADDSVDEKLVEVSLAT
jgi:hypothetical protein